MPTAHAPAHPVPWSRSFSGPVVVAVRGPSRSGKTRLCEEIVRALSQDGVQVAWLKRTHHLVDVPGKASDRIWAAGPAVSALRASDRLTLTLPPGDPEPAALLAHIPEAVDLVLFETHTPVPFPTLLSTLLEAEPGEPVIGRFSLFGEAAALQTARTPLRQLIGADLTLSRAIRSAVRAHGGHGCAGLILGTRLALVGATALGVDVPDTHKRLIVLSETDRCAVDGIQAVTGCRPGKRTLRILDYGKLAATFLDEHSGRSVRVAARSDLRERVGVVGEGRHEAQRAAYATWPAEDLFSVAERSVELSQYDRPGPPRARVRCVACGEEVNDGRHLETESGARCRPCLASAGVPIPVYGASQR